MPLKAIEQDYKGYPTLILTWEGGQWPDKRPFSLGISNAKRVIAGIEQIKAFVDRHKNDPRPTRPDQQQPARGEYDSPPAVSGPPRQASTPPRQPSAPPRPQPQQRDQSA